MLDLPTISTRSSPPAACRVGGDHRHGRLRDMVEALATSPSSTRTRAADNAALREGSLGWRKRCDALLWPGKETGRGLPGQEADNIPGGRTICAFGEACSWPVQSFVAKFKDEFVARGAADEARRASMQPDSASENEAVVTHP